MRLNNDKQDEQPKIVIHNWMFYFHDQPEMD